MPYSTRSTERVLYKHIGNLPSAQSGWVVYPIATPPYIEEATVLASEVLQHLQPTTERLHSMLFSTLRAVQRHPACEPGYLQPARIGYSLMGDSIYFCFLDDTRDLMFVVTNGIWDSLVKRCVYSHLIMPPLVLVGESHIRISNMLRRRAKNHDSTPSEERM
jgi:hypothetical protein